MRRRQFIAALGSAGLFALPGLAQQPAVPVIGFLDSGSLDRYRPFLDAFRQGRRPPHQTQPSEALVPRLRPR
jgi:putative ABC transport system substrate-binding protein